MVASSAYYVHTFTWHGPADSITVTGSFDNWSSSLQLELDSPSSTGLRRGTATPRKKGDTEDQQWTATCELDWGEKIVYKVSGGGARFSCGVASVSNRGKYECCRGDRRAWERGTQLRVWQSDGARLSNVGEIVEERRHAMVLCGEEKLSLMETYSEISLPSSHRRTYLDLSEMIHELRVRNQYIINNREWVHSMTEPHEADDSGNVNNVFIAPSLDIPHIPLSTPLEFTSTDRNLQVVRWDEDEFDDGEGKLEVLAGTYTSPSLKYSTLRAILALFLSVPSGSYQFGRLLAPASHNEKRGKYDIEMVLEPKRTAKEARLKEMAVEKEEGLNLSEEPVESGFYVLLQPAESPTPKLKPTTNVSLSHHLSLTSHQMGSSTDSLESFSTALSTATASALGPGSSIGGEESYVCVHDTGRLWSYVPPPGGEHEAEEEVRKAWFDLQWGFDPLTAYTPLAFTPATSSLVPYLSYVPPPTKLEQTQCEEYLEGHFLECVNRWVRGKGQAEELVEVGTDDEWEEA